MVSCQFGDAFFVHINKNGGTSVSNAAKSLDRVDFGRSHGYEPAMFYRDRVPDWHNRWTFSVVRNPWDRLASLYRFTVHKHNMKMWRTEPHISDAKLKNELKRRCRSDFDFWLMEFCEKYKFWPNGSVRQKRPFTQVPQYDWLFEDGHQQVVDVFKMENMGDLAEVLKDRYGVRLERDNVTTPDGGKDYRPYFTSRSRDYVGDIFGDDIRQWRYTF